MHRYPNNKAYCVAFPGGAAGGSRAKVSQKCIFNIPVLGSPNARKILEKTPVTMCHPARGGRPKAALRSFFLIYSNEFCTIKTKMNSFRFPRPEAFLVFFAFFPRVSPRRSRVARVAPGVACRPGGPGDPRGLPFAHYGERGGPWGTPGTGGQ